MVRIFRPDNRWHCCGAPVEGLEPGQEGGAAADRLEQGECFGSATSRPAKARLITILRGSLRSRLRMTAVLLAASPQRLRQRFRKGLVGSVEPQRRHRHVTG